MKKEQQILKNTKKSKVSAGKLNLQGSDEEISVWEGQIKGLNPIYIVIESLLAEKLYSIPTNGPFMVEHY